MFKITDRAAQLLKTALSQAEDTEGACFRIGVVDNKVQLLVDRERPGDTAIEHEGEALVVLDRAAGNALDNHELDYDSEAPGFVLNEAG